MKILLQWRLLVWPMLLLTLLGCAALKVTSYYLFVSIEPLQRMVPEGEPLVLVVKPVILPDYVKQAQIITQDKDSRVTLSKLHHWAEPVIDGVERVMIENLAMRLHGDVLPYQQRLQPQKIDYFLSLRVIEFIGQPGEEAHLKAHWQILDGAHQKALLSRYSELNETIQAIHYDGMVRAESRLLGRLSDEVGAALRLLSIERSAIGRHR